jgi:hypothetical protein
VSLRVAQLLGYNKVKVLGWLNWVLDWFFFFKDVLFCFLQSCFTKFDMSSEFLPACQSSACCIDFPKSTVLLWTRPIGFYVLLVWVVGAQGF